MADHTWTAARVVHCNATLWRRNGHAWQALGASGSVSPLHALPNRLTGPVTVVVDSDGNVACDLSALTCLDGFVRELTDRELGNG